MTAHYCGQGRVKTLNPSPRAMLFSKYRVITQLTLRSRIIPIWFRVQSKVKQKLRTIFGGKIQEGQIWTKFNCFRRTSTMYREREKEQTKWIISWSWSQLISHVLTQARFHKHNILKNTVETQIWALSISFSTFTFTLSLSNFHTLTLSLLHFHTTFTFS